MRHPGMTELMAMTELKSKNIVVAGGGGLHILDRDGEPRISIC